MARPHSTETIAKIRAQYEAGATQGQISESLGLQQTMVSKLMMRHGIPRRRYGSHIKPGPTNGSWKGDAAGYNAMHRRVRLARGHPSLCQECGTDDPAKRYEWANISGRFGDVSDYLRMCSTCHKRRDRRLKRLRLIEAGKDTARLDWLQRSGSDLIGPMVVPEFGPAPTAWMVTHPQQGSDGPLAHGVSARAAIDAAMQTTERGGSD